MPEIFGRRTWLWAIVLILVGIVLIRYRGSGPHPVKTLVPAAIPTAAAYAHDVVSKARCAQAKSLQHPNLPDPCSTFSDLQGMRVVGSGHIVRHCGNTASDADCVRFAVRGARARGALSLVLERRGSGWRVAGASATTHA